MAALHSSQKKILFNYEEPHIYTICMRERLPSCPIDPVQRVGGRRGLRSPAHTHISSRSKWGASRSMAPCASEQTTQDQTSSSWSSHHCFFLHTLQPECYAGVWHKCVCKRVWECKSVCAMCVRLCVFECVRVCQWVRPWLRQFVRIWECMSVQYCVCERKNMCVSKCMCLCAFSNHLKIRWK